MDKKKQIELLKYFHEAMEEILIKKGNDYSNEDCLSNFKQVANIVGVTPEQVVLTMMSIKIARLGVLLSIPEEQIKNESIEDSIIDLANYTFLLDCVMIERKHLTSKQMPF